MNFFRFPHTPHLAWLGDGHPRDDKVLSTAEVTTFLSNEVVIEEKVDGANLGVSFDSSGNLRLQNRGAYLERPWSGQFAKVEHWLLPHIDSLFDVLGDRLIVFGEWCAATHSLNYDELPDWFLGFDVYDRQSGQFLATKRRDELFFLSNIFPVRKVAHGHFDIPQLIGLLAREKSAYRAGPLEGMYLRVENDKYLLSRAKLVRADFTQQISEHWRKRAICWNRIAPPYGM